MKRSALLSGLIELETVGLIQGALGVRGFLHMTYLVSGLNLAYALGEECIPAPAACVLWKII